MPPEALIISLLCSFGIFVTAAISEHKHSIKLKGRINKSRSVTSGSDLKLENFDKLRELVREDNWTEEFGDVNMEEIV